MTHFMRNGRSVLPATLAVIVLSLTITPNTFAARGHVFGFTVGWGVSDGKPELEVCRSKCQAAITGNGKGQFATPVGVATNEATGDFYVLDEANNRVVRFGAHGEYLGEFDGSGTYENEGKELTGGAPPTGRLEGPRAITVDNSCIQSKLSATECKAKDPSAGDVYVEDGEHAPHNRVVDKFAPTGEYVGQAVVPLYAGPGAQQTLMNGVAVDAAGDLWVAEQQGQEHRGFDRFNDAVVNESEVFVKAHGPDFVFFGLEHPGLAVGDDGDLYTVRGFEQPFGEVVAGFSGSGEQLGVVDRVRSRGVGVEWRSGDVFVDEVGSIVRFTSGFPAVEVERFGGGVLGDGRGLAASSSLVVGDPDREGPVFVADAGAGDVAVFPLEGPKPPTVQEPSVDAVTADSAVLRSIVNPRGARSEYRFEYGQCASVASCSSSPFEVSVPASGENTVGAPFDFEPHAISVDLQGLVAGSAYHFRVLARNELDGPGEYTESSEVTFRTEPGVPVERLLDGRAWELVSPGDKYGALIQPIDAPGVIQAANGGDAITYVADSPTEPEPQGYTNFVQVLSRRTGKGWVSEDLTVPHLRATTQSVGEGEEYRFFSEDLSVGLVQPFGSFDPAVSAQASEQTAFVRSNFPAGNVEAACTSGCYTPLVTAANTREGAVFGEEGHCPPVVICGPRVRAASPDGRHAIVESPVGLTSVEGDKGGSYEWSDGELEPVTVLPNGKPDPVIHGVGGRNAVSRDGSRVVWSDGRSLYQRNMLTGETVEVSKGVVGVPVFETASMDGSRVFFTASGNLYVYEQGAAGPTRLTVPVNAGEETGLQGKLVGASEDGTYVDFTANGRLSNEGQEREGSCQGGGSNEAEDCYLYVMRMEEGAWQAPRLVATISGADRPDFETGLPHLTTRVSPDGRWLSFMSQLSLTGYDNHDAVSGVRDEEVYLYDANSGMLACVSCNPTGERPTGIEYAQLEGGLVSGDRVWRPTSWLAANIPGWTPYALEQSAHQSRYLSDDGRVFFNSSDALVPGDVNGNEDVYEYEPAGVGSCTTANPAYSEATSGCVDLISSGTSRGESSFLDASQTGSDVFFLTGAKLVSGDYDTGLDVYDAHECSTTTPCLPEPASVPPACTTEASCKAPPTPQPEIFGAPATATFTGIGNPIPLATTAGKPTVKRLTRAQRLARALKACAKQRGKRKRAACRKQARRQAQTRRGLTVSPR